MRSEQRSGAAQHRRKEVLRRRVDRDALKADFEAAVDGSLKLAEKTEAQSLPGWCEPTVGAIPEGNGLAAEAA